MIGWIVAALVGLFAVPNFYLHYAMPLLVPLCVAASSLPGARLVGIGATAALAALSLLARRRPSSIDRIAEGKAAMAALTDGGAPASRRTARCWSMTGRRSSTR